MRTAPMLLKSVALAAMLYAMQASAAYQVGDTTGSPTFNRPLVDLSGLSAVGTDVAYDSFSFSVDTAGTYTFFSLALPLLPLNNFPVWDNFIILYAGGFDPNSPLSNAVMANDDANNDANNIGRSRFDFGLSTDVAYTLVTTGFANDDFGRYLNVIRGPGEITAPVPEPETYALLLAGLAVVGFVAGRRRQS